MIFSCTWLFSWCISISFASWKFSRMICGRVSQSSSSPIFGRLVLISFSNCVSRLEPGAGMHMPFGFWRMNLLWEISSRLGVVVVAAPGMNATVSFRPLRCSGRYASLGYGGMMRVVPLGFRSLSIRSMVSYDGAAVATIRFALTYSVGVMRKNTAPHRVSPRPMNASTGEFALMEKPNARIPGMRKAKPMAMVRFMFIRITLGVNSCSSWVGCCSTGVSTSVVCS